MHKTEVPTSELKCIVFLQADIDILKNTKAAITTQKWTNHCGRNDTLGSVIFSV